MHHVLLVVSFAACLGIPDLVASLEPREGMRRPGVAAKLRQWMDSL